MKLNNCNNNLFFTGSLMVLTMTATLHYREVEGAPRLMSRDAEFRQPNQPPQTDPELNSLNKQAAQQQDNFVAKQQQFNGNNEPDIAPLNQYPMRHQQHLKFPLQQLQFEDEHAMRRQLPDLIAQAHTDKTIERALLKMLINASLRSALTNAVSSGSPYSWRQDNNEITNGLDGGPPAPRALSAARLDQVIDEFAGVDPLIANDFGSTTYQQEPVQYSAGIGKREYIKPCFFNAVACAKNNPFRES